MKKVFFLFTLSILGSIVFFWFLDSNAAINNKYIELGGAIAGFFVIYKLLEHSYNYYSASISNEQALAIIRMWQEAQCSYYIRYLSEIIDNNEIPPIDEVLRKLKDMREKSMASLHCIRTKKGRLSDYFNSFYPTTEYTDGIEEVLSVLGEDINNNKKKNKVIQIIDRKREVLFNKYSSDFAD